MMRQGTAQAGVTDSVRRVLVLALSGIGNMVMTTPMLAACRAAFPRATITIAATPRGALDAVSEGPLLDAHVIVRKGQSKLPASAIKAGLSLRRRSFDLVLVCWASQGVFGNLLAWLTGAPVRVGFDSRWAALLTHYVTVQIGRHETQLNLDLLRAIGIDPVVSRPSFSFSEADQQAAKAALARVPAAERGIVALHPGSYANMSEKRWPATRFAELGDRIAGAYGLGVALVGGPEERPLACGVADAMTVPAGVLAGHLTLKQTAAALHQCRLLVANCSGLMHTAAAAGSCVVAIYGPTDWRTSGPTGEGHVVVRNQLPCCPCYTASTMGRPIICPRGIECLRTLNVDDVFAATRLALGSPGACARHVVNGRVVGAPELASTAASVGPS